MAINTQLPFAAQAQPLQMPDPNAGMNALARAMTVRGMVDEQKLRAQALAESNALNEAYRGAYGADGQVDRNKLFSSLATSGVGSKIPGIQKQFAEADKAQFDVRKAAAEGYKLFQSTIGARLNDPNLSREAVLQDVSGLIQSGSFDGQVAIKLLQSLPEDPQQLRAHLRQAITSQMTPEQMLTAFAPKPEKFDNGQFIETRDMNPNSPTYGQATGGAPVQKVATPGEVMTDQRVRSEGSLNRGVQLRGQDLTNQRAVDSNTIAAQGNVVKTETDLRKEFADLPEVKRYKAAYPSYAAIEKAARTNNPQADINLIYGLAKLYDPESVVREGEYGTIANSQAIPEWLKGQAQRLAGGGKLTSETKRQILEQAQGRILTFQDEYQKARGAYDSIARGRQASPDRVFTPVGEPVTPTVDFGSLPTGKGGKPAGRGNAPTGAPRELQWGK